MSVRQLRVVVTADDYDEALRFYRDVLGWRQIVPDPDGQRSMPFPAVAFAAPGGRTHHELLLELWVEVMS